MEDPVIKIGGMERPVRLTMADGALLQKHFGFEKPGMWLVNRVLGVNFDGTSASGFGSYDLTGQLSTIALAVNRGAGKKLKDRVTEDKVSNWLDEIHEQIRDEKAEPNAVKLVLWTVVAAAFDAGWVMEKPYDLKAEHEDVYRLFFGLKEDEAPETEAPAPASAIPSIASSVREEG